MALNDTVLSQTTGLGAFPVAAAVAAYSVASKLFGAGPTAEFLARQKLRDLKDQIVAQYKAIIPTLPKWQQDIVSGDLDEFVFRMTRDNMSKADYERELAWFQGRETAWQSMTEPGQSVTITRAQMIKKLGGGAEGEAAYNRILAAEAAGQLPPMESSLVTPGAVAPIEAGMSLPVLLLLGGVLVWIAFGKK